MKEKIFEAIQQFDTIIIHRHVRPDPDAYGSQCGLAEMLKASFPAKEVYVVGKDEESLTFLKQMNVISETIYEKALVIVCDTANQDRICDSRYGKGEMLIKIDHHPNDDPYGDIVWVDTTFSSTSEMIYEFYLHGKDKDLVLNKEAARLIYAGIVGDTGRFLFPSTTSRTFKYAADLIDYDFSFPKLYNSLYRTKRNVANLSGFVLQNFTLLDSGIASILISKEMLTEFNVTTSDASQIVGLLGNIEGVKAWVFFVEEDDQIRVRLRSKGVVINQVAKKFNGGGHPLAAGASIYSWDEVDDVIAELEAASRR